MNPQNENAQIEAIVFDMDGVLLNTEEISERAWRDAAAALSLPAALPLYSSIIGTTMQATEELLTCALGEEAAKLFMAEWDAGFDKIAEAEGIPAMPFAAEALSRLKGRYRLALASSTEGSRVRAQLSDAGLLGFFEALATGDMVQRGKPAPDIYIKACEMLSLPPNSCAAVEDSPNGVQSAYSAGLLPIMIPDRIAPDEKTRALLWRQFSSLEELCCGIQSLELRA